MTETTPGPLRGSGIWDVAVVGAGPAGALAARELGRLGCRVVLLERQEFPRWKVCGACLSPGAQDVLRRAGLGDLPAQQGARPLEILRLGGWSSTADVPLRGSLALSRGAFDTALVEAARSEGVLFVSGAGVRLEEVTPEAVHLRVGFQAGAEEVTARVVVAADGLRSGILARCGDVGRGGGGKPAGLEGRGGGGGAARSDGGKPAGLASRGEDRGRAPEGGRSASPTGSESGKVGLGAVFAETDPGYEAGVIHMAVGAEGYVGLVRTEDGHLNVGAAVRAAAVGRRRPPAEVVATILREAPFPSLEGEPLEGWRGTPGLGYHPRMPGGERVFAVGDAAGYVEPFTGEGMSWALAGAWTLAPIVRRAVDGWSHQHLEEWRHAYGRTVGRAQRVCRGAAWTLDRPRLSRAAIRLLSVLPQAAAPLVAGAASPPPSLSRRAS
jgi:menaquinone-9 beta-reductase